MDDSPLGPSVTLTALARTSTPLSILARPSLENLISLCAPRASTGRAAFAAALRAARDDEDEMACMVVFLEERGDEEKNGKRGRRETEQKCAGLKNFPV